MQLPCPKQSKKFLLSSTCFSCEVKVQNQFNRYNHHNVGTSAEDKELAQKRESQKIAYWSLGVDVFMTTVKGGVGWMLNSTAIIADISFFHD